MSEPELTPDVAGLLARLNAIVDAGKKFSMPQINYEPMDKTCADAAALIEQQQRLLAEMETALDQNWVTHQRVVKAEAAASANAKDAERYRFVLPMIGGEESAEADRRTLLIGAALMKGLTGDAAVDYTIDAALSEPDEKGR